MSENKRCPFCGWWPREATSSHNIVCQNVVCEIYNVYIDADAWNRRPVEDDLLAACEAAWNVYPEWDDSTYTKVQSAIAKARGES